MERWSKSTFFVFRFIVFFSSVWSGAFAFYLVFLLREAGIGVSWHYLPAVFFVAFPLAILFCCFLYWAVHSALTSDRPNPMIARLSPRKIRWSSGAKASEGAY